MKTVSIMELRKNVYSATKELPIMVTAKGETLFYIVKELSTVKPVIEEKVSTLPPTKTEEVSTDKGDYMWEDSNWLPVYKVGEDEQFCSTFHVAGLKQRVYKISKYRADGTLEWIKKLCMKCVRMELEKIKTLGGHLE